MLEALDAIDWSQVMSCYGNSEKIPEAIRGLLSDDEEAREAAFQILWSELQHQGSADNRA